MIPKITANGYALLLNALDGVGIQFSKIVVGNGEKPADYRVLSDLQNPILSAEITEITRMEKYAILRAPMLNSDVEGRLHWTELGVFTKNPSGGEDILYGYAHTDLSGDGQGISVPSYDTNMIELAHIIYVYVGEVDDVTAIIAQSSEYASAAALSNHTTNTSNPHKVTPQQVGLGNVPNVTPENQKPVFSETVTSVTTSDDGTKSLPNILNGDIMGVILQKIRSAISAFISHLNAKNPHGLGASDVGAASATHYHSATDINKGTLSLLRGGTGGTTADEARKNIGAAAADHTHKYAGSSTTGGAANSAVKLSTARKVTVNLSSESGADFDGSKAIAPGVSGILQIKHGGTGAATEEQARANLGIITSDEIANLYVWKKYEGILVKNQNMGDMGTGACTIRYCETVNVANGTFTPGNIQTTTATGTTDSNLDKIKGKYVVMGAEAPYTLYFVPTNASFSSYSSGTDLLIRANEAYKLATKAGYAAAKSSGAYPTGSQHSDGYWYEYHKQLGD